MGVFLWERYPCMRRFMPFPPVSLDSLTGGAYMAYKPTVLGDLAHKKQPPPPRTIIGP